MTITRWKDWDRARNLLLKLFLASIIASCGDNDPSPSGAPEISAAKALPPLPTTTVPSCALITHYDPHQGSIVAPSCEYLGNPKDPLVVVLGLAAQQTLDSVYEWGGVPELMSAGYSLLSLDLPCHGNDSPPPSVGTSHLGLGCWADRIHAGDRDIFLNFCSELEEALDELHPTSVGIVGVSRGGYVAIVCAAYDTRITAIALEAPVTDLNYLAEFKVLPVDESLFNTDQYVPYLESRPVLVRIGAHDTRVGTWKAERFAKEVHAQVQVLDCAGHCAPEDGSTLKFLDDYLMNPIREPSLE